MRMHQPAIYCRALGEEDKSVVSERVKVMKQDFFPYLDIEMRWDENDDLKFGIYMKENQVIKYLNAGSQHTKSCFKAIPSGVFKRLTKLTTITNESKNLTMDKIYPIHAEALSKAGLVQSFPTFTEVYSEI